MRNIDLKLKSHVWLLFHWVTVGLICKTDINCFIKGFFYPLFVFKGDKNKCSEIYLSIEKCFSQTPILLFMKLSFQTCKFLYCNSILTKWRIYIGIVIIYSLGPLSLKVTPLIRPLFYFFIVEGVVMYEGDQMN